MTDIMSKEKRSALMSRIRGKWTMPERKIHAYLKSQKIRHRMHPKLSGNPDVLLPDRGIVIFIDGCFWHKCPIHFVQPKTRVEFWKSKIEGNAKRARQANKVLKKNGFKVIRIWGHEFKNEAYKHTLNRNTGRMPTQLNNSKQVSIFIPEYSST